jgi:hypothetical protein
MKPFNIRIESIPHDKQRYETIGDWYRDQSGNLQIKVSETGNNDYNFLVAIHELVEVWLCEKRGIELSVVDGFDQAYEINRQKGDDSEPGDSPKAPYKNEHCIATGIERIMCAALGIDWRDYEDALTSTENRIF